MTTRNSTQKNRLVALLLQRCPVCLEGKVFYSFLGMHKTCPNCGIRYERETGYFLNAMFFAYTMGFVIIAPTALILYLLGVSVLWFSIVVSAELLLLWPFIFRYSRVLWMHIDQLLDPRQLEPIPGESPVEE